MTEPQTPQVILPELSERVIGAGMKTLNCLKTGLSEKTYENVLVIELRERGCMVEQQKTVRRVLRRQLVDTLVPELVLNNALIVDPKVIEEFNRTHFAQMIGYLTVIGLGLAILMNFKNADLRWRRVALTRRSADSDHRSSNRFNRGFRGGTLMELSTGLLSAFRREICG